MEEVFAARVASINSKKGREHACAPHMIKYKYTSIDVASNDSLRAGTDCIEHVI